VKTSSVPETYNERRQRVLEETKDLDASDSDSDTGDSDEESDSDSDDELLRELAKLKEEKLQKEKEQQQRAQERALAQQDSQQQQQQPVKKSWRQSVFKNNAGQGQDKNGEYVNDLLKSQFHQRFMDKHVR
jgi:protein CWC15